MMKMTNYIKVAVIEYNNQDYHYAIYEDGYEYQIGNEVLVTGALRNQVLIIKDILTPEEAKIAFSKNIKQEVICKVDTSAYDERVRIRKEKEEIKKEMDKLVKSLEEDSKYDIYASRSPELAEMLKKYKSM